MQAQLLDSLFGTERGLSASSEVRAEINELITQLEAKSPNSDLSEVCPRLDVLFAAAQVTAETSDLITQAKVPVSTMSQSCPHLTEGHYTWGSSHPPQEVYCSQCF